MALILDTDMELDRRQLLLSGGALLASCRTTIEPPAVDGTNALDALLAAHAEAMPEAPGAGANHYPMAAEVLDTLGAATALPPSWYAGVAGYPGPPARVAPIGAERPPLGSYDRFGDWLDLFRTELRQRPWRSVVAHWAPRLAPGVSAAAFHGVIRTAHAVRALGHVETSPRRHELAVGLAYWAARYAELQATADAPGDHDLVAELARIARHTANDPADVDFFTVSTRLQQAAVPAAALDPWPADPARAIDDLVRAAATGLLEMLVQERHRIWLLHTVTGPAAVGILLPHTDAAGAQRLVAYARQAVAAFFAAFAAPFEPRAHVRRSPPAWSELIREAIARESLHTLKLLEALARHDDGSGGDPLLRSVAVQWLEWR